MYILEIDNIDEIEKILSIAKKRNLKVRLTVEIDNANLYAALIRHYKGKTYVIR